MFKYLKMSKNKKREHRKPFRGSKDFDKTCCNHGSCPYCESNRLYQVKKEKMRIKDSLDEWNKKEED